VGLERGSLSLVSTTEELLDRKSSGSCLENREYGRRGSAELTTRHPSIHKKLALTSLTSGGWLGRYSSLADSDHGVWFNLVFLFSNFNIDHDNVAYCMPFDSMDLL
jgi:hypothetical protein